jgi:hypothetical protein
MNVTDGVVMVVGGVVQAALEGRGYVYLAQLRQMTDEEVDQVL